MEKVILNPFVRECSKDDEEEEDTLSLSDLPMYCDHNIEFFVEEDPNMILHDPDFEFSREMMITSHPDNSSNPIVFCGKIIQVSPQKIEIKKNQIRCVRRGMNVGRKVKVSVLNPAIKSRWLLLMIGFGSSRFPAKEMHIGDLRKRRTSGRQIRISINNGYSSSDEGDDGRRGSRGFLRFLGCVGGGGGGDGVKPSKHHY